MSTLEIQLGQSVTLTWDFENAQTVMIDQGIGAVPKSGEIKVNPLVDTIYTLTATNILGDTAIQQIEVMVKQVPQIASLSSNVGTVGDNIQIIGQNFDPTPSNNLVEFQGPGGIRLSSNINSATNTVLEVEVPSATLSGPIQVTINGVKSNSVNFNINTLSNFAFTTNNIPSLMNDHVDGVSFAVDNVIYTIAGGNNLIDFFNTVTKVVGNIGVISVPRSGSPVIAKDGKLIYLIGGNDTTLYTQRFVEEFDISTFDLDILGLDAIFPLGENGTNRCGAQVGQDLFFFTDGDTLKFNLSTKTWSSGFTPHPDSPILAKAIEKDGEIYVFGGGGQNDSLAQKVYKYNPTLDTWQVLADSPQPLCGHAVSVLNDHIVVTGGKFNDTLIQVYDTSTNTWKSSLLSQITSLPPTMRKYNHNSVVVNGELYLIGGNNKQIIKLIPIAN